jgi:hypothetical protein
MATIAISELECPQCKTLNPHTVDKCKNCGLPRSPESILRPVPITAKLEIPEKESSPGYRIVGIEQPNLEGQDSDLDRIPSPTWESILSDEPEGEPVRIVDLEPEALHAALANGSIAILEPSSVSAEGELEPDMEPTIETPAETHSVSRREPATTLLPGIEPEAVQANSTTVVNPTIASTPAPSESTAPAIPTRRYGWRGCLLWAAGAIAILLIIGFVVIPILQRGTGGAPAPTDTPPTTSPTSRSIEPSPVFPTSITAPGGAAQTATAIGYTPTTTSTAIPATATKLIPTVLTPKTAVPTSPAATAVAPTMAILPTIQATVAAAYPGPVENSAVVPTSLAIIPPTAKVAVASAEAILINSTESMTATGVFTAPTTLAQIFSNNDVAKFTLIKGSAKASVEIFSDSKSIAGYELQIVDGDLPIKLNSGETARITIIPSSTPVELTVVRVPAAADGNKAAECDETGCGK